MSGYAFARVSEAMEDLRLAIRDQHSRSNINAHAWRELEEARQALDSALGKLKEAGQ